MSKTKSQIYVNVLLIICLSLVIFGCSTEKSNPDFVDPTAHPELVDQSWLTSNPCAAPCWQGLEPGKSTREEVLKTLPNLSFLDYQKGITDFAGQDIVKCKQPSDKNCLFFILKNDRLDRLGFLLEYSITLDEVVSQLGEPDFLAIIPNANERGDCFFQVYWLHQRLVITNEYIGKGYLPFQHDLCDRIQESNGKVPKMVEIQMASIYSPEMLDEVTKMIYNGRPNYLWTGFSD
jgi:hypothetical protein